MAIDIATDVAWIGAASIVVLAGWFFIVHSDFKRYCKAVADLEGRIDEMHNSRSNGEGYSAFEMEIYWRIWRRDYPANGDDSLFEAGENIRSRYVMVANVYIPAAFLVLILPAIL